MCGIAGVRRFGPTPITGEEIVLLLCSIEHRGNHATGIAIMSAAGELSVLKQACPAWQFTKSKEFREFLQEKLLEDTKTVLLHTRWATTGSPAVNANNHPISDGETAIIHNGMIHNHSFLFNQMKQERNCETDSDIIRAIVSEHGFCEKSLRELNKMSGSAAIACISQKDPTKLLIARSGSPVTYAFSENGDKFYWASEAQAIMKSTKPFREVRGVWVQDTRSNVSVGNMPDNTAWIFNDDNFEIHGEFKTCAHYNAPDYSRGRSTYHAKTKGWRQELKRLKRLATTAVTGGVKGPVVDVETLVAPPKGLKGALKQCPKCETMCINSKGLPWSICQCPNCHTRME